MTAIRLKTNIKCSGCIEKITPYLDDAVGPGKWNVDLNNPERILTVMGTANDETVKTALLKAGYKGETI